MSSKISKPYLINFKRIGEPSIGFISVGEFEKEIPFEVKRAFWTYHTPESIVRGRHAHYKTKLFLLAVSGRIIITTESLDGSMNTFSLDSPDVGLYIPPYCWHTMQYSHTAVQLVFASTPYDPADYIRSYEDFKQMVNNRTSGLG